MQNRQVQLRHDSDNCRRMALLYAGRPEATFLLNAAKAFAELADGSIVSGSLHPNKQEY
ncbi:MAG: hypothetical protein NVSMB6_28560 [Burkholderiaceae bacterium]